VVDRSDNHNLERSTRNLAKAQFLSTEGLNVYDVLRFDHLILSQEGAKEIERRLSR